MNVLVCGGAGYIGSNMTAILAEKGHKPIVFDNFSKGHKDAIKGHELVEGDLADLGLLVKVLKEKKIEAVMHFAAFIEVGESCTKPLEYYRNNFSNTRTLLEAMEKTEVRKFVFSSTAATYGMPKEVPITEDLHKEPINPYGESKWAVERMCHFQSLTGRLNYAALRYFNACGAGGNGTIGEDHTPESHLIPLVIAAAMGKREDIKVFGTDYPTPDGTCIRDYIHIEDLCSAHLLALEKLDTNSELVFNLGNGKGYSVREVIETVKKVSGKNVKVTEVARRPGDPPVLTADASKAIRELGWKVKYPQLEKIVETAWLWHSRNPQGYTL
ncbi:MAG: UDP-glucose 4-epimerase GalE [Planctomycetes bacterium GWF2_41_51]|nr:MAG: UDP-glucose 4-epimerase GalE [Planctomycetes bacterium GWF2_41_51]HBG26220.1 UDP-glucose 4-epimerase GalE [Phycisphaerales bacterium]